MYKPIGWGDKDPLGLICVSFECLWFNLGFVGGIWARHLILIFWNSLEHKCLWFEYVSCNLWALGLPYGPLRNYNALAVGFDYSAGNYCGGSLAYGIPDGIVPPDIENIKLGMHKYAESLGVKASGGDLVVTKWVEVWESEA
jgi:hypothetical protein